VSPFARIQAHLINYFESDQQQQRKKQRIQCTADSVAANDIVMSCGVKRNEN